MRRWAEGSHRSWDEHYKNQECINSMHWWAIGSHHSNFMLIHSTYTMKRIVRAIEQHMTACNTQMHVHELHTPGHVQTNNATSMSLASTCRKILFTEHTLTYLHLLTCSVGPKPVTERDSLMHMLKLHSQLHVQNTIPASMPLLRVGQSLWLLSTWAEWFARVNQHCQAYCQAWLTQI